jgi:hypothetical protein
MLSSRNEYGPAGNLQICRYRRLKIGEDLPVDRDDVALNVARSRTWSRLGRYRCPLACASCTGLVRFSTIVRLRVLVVLGISGIQRKKPPSLSGRRLKFQLRGTTLVGHCSRSYPALRVRDVEFNRPIPSSQLTVESPSPPTCQSVRGAAPGSIPRSRCRRTPTNHRLSETRLNAYSFRSTPFHALFVFAAAYPSRAVMSSDARVYCDERTRISIHRGGSTSLVLPNVNDRCHRPVWPIGILQELRWTAGACGRVR